ncbi:hypothetical protein C0Q70_15959 [Pomacea canaliculata]|uniref:Uncharacterized protein n=1 Tax=Pomacea canaliculata TaxID=400727 RepID=A0A2T7NNH0_POMCA|nr:hypothetical protein C0Q70_15959 [Pomacea canaliculata]
MANRCETVLPLSEDYFSVIGYKKWWFIGVDAVLTVAILLLLLDDIVFVCRTYSHEDIKTKSVWLMAVYPLSDTICTLQSIQFLPQLPGSMPVTVQLPHTPVLRKSQEPADEGEGHRIQPQNSPSVLLLLLLSHAEVNAIDFRKSFVYLTTAKVMSTIIALHGLNALHSATVLHLRSHSMAVKKLMLQLVLIFQNIQGAILNILARFDIPSCTSEFSSYSQMQEWHHLALVVEMFLLALVARIFYRRPLQLDAGLEEQSADVVSIYVTRNERAVQPLPVSSARPSLGLDFNHEGGSPTPVPAGGDVTLDQDGLERRHDSDGTEFHRGEAESQDTKSSLAADVDCTDNLHTNIAIRWK